MRRATRGATPALIRSWRTRRAAPGRLFGIFTRATIKTARLLPLCRFASLPVFSSTRPDPRFGSCCHVLARLIHTAAALSRFAKSIGGMSPRSVRASMSFAPKCRPCLLVECPRIGAAARIRPVSAARCRPESRCVVRSNADGRRRRLLNGSCPSHARRCDREARSRARPAAALLRAADARDWGRAVDRRKVPCL